MDRTKWFFHPILVFILSLLALATSLILYIYWYIEVSAGLKNLMEKFNLDTGQILTAQTWVVILVLSVLVTVILLGLWLIFAYSRKMVQMYRMQRNFIDNFTHELKTPVASLRLYLETFQKHALERSEQLKYIDFMLGDAQRLTNTINRILDLARIESKNYPGEFACLNPVEIIANFFASNRSIAQRCRTQVHTDGTVHSCCRINPALFEILLTNMMTNAIKYNTSEQPAVDIRVRRHGRQLRISFEDNGIGFERGERKKIFKKFYQIGKSADMTAKGSGIGLYMVQNIARIHKAKIRAESTGPGRGAVFTLSLPLAEKTGA